ncbi:MAG: glycosyltransferase family 2 protein [Bacteroidales bacterium]|nr:glycosyltransferase family 2 protein [Bacteroidales bacterium]
MKSLYSVIIPVYNSASTLKELNTRIISSFEKENTSFEIVYVEDGGNDNSWQIIKSLKNEFPDLVRGFRLSKNFGQHNATFCGMKFAKGDYIITIDDDLQLLPEEIPMLINRQIETGADLVYGIFSKNQHSFYRRVGSSYMKRAGKIVSNTPGKGSSFRLITKDLTNKILNHHQNFVYIDELLLWYTDFIEFVQVTHQKRKNSKSGYSPVKLFKLAFNITIYYTTVPLKLMVAGGLIISFISFLLGLWFIYKKIYHNVPLGYTSMIVAILFSTSIILVSLGIIGEYLSRIYMVQNKKPPYTIREKV